MNNQIEPDRQKDFYNDHTPQHLDYESNKPFAQYFAGIIRKYLKKKINLLEIGAGQGRFTLEMARHAQSVTAVDLSPAQIELLGKAAKINKIKNIIPVAGDVLEIDKILKRSLKFDTIFGIFILHHLPVGKIDLLIKLSKSRLNSHGRLVFIEPNKWNFQYVLAIIFRPDMSWELEKGMYSKYAQVFQKECYRAGFTLVKHTRFGFFPPVIINKFPGITKLDFIIESIPFINKILCPYELFVFET